MQLGWIDYSKAERNKIAYILKMLGSQTALDEIGVGTIRDGFSDILFPGISTLQTRAKYFVLIPYIFGEAEKQRYDRPNNVRTWINRQEEQLVATLIESSEPRADGIIGSRSYRHGQTVKQKPSSIYWNGMRTFGILRQSGVSMDNACELVFRHSKKRRELSLKAEGDNDGGDDRDAQNGEIVVFSPILPEYEYMKNASIDLTNREASFLLEKITRADASKDSLLSFMLNKGILFDDFQSINTEILPNHLKRIVLLAQDFADFIYGAHLLYNVIYSEGTDMVDEFEEWMLEYHQVDLDEIANCSGCTDHTRKFLHRFNLNILAGDIEAAKQTIVAREEFIKRDRAKLLKPQEYRYESAIHNYKLNYRYDTAKTIITDILKGLEGTYGTTNV